ncbi:hypothetical protein BBJ28_00021865 [Nothophytophthora sp. Chile5]|nr:hypothetical protein BBJ28_00021865 [Nothophytophthora sp. Chile5]
MPGSAAAPSPPRPAAERVHGLQSGELFVRLNGASLCAPGGVLHGARPFLLSLLQLQDGGESLMQQFVAPSSSKVVFSRQMRGQTRQRRRAIEKLRRALQDAVEGHDAMAHRLLSPPAEALERYLQQFRSLEKAYKQHATSDILSLYALLEAEGQYIAEWRRRERSACRDQRARTTLLYRFKYLESETSGQIRMWRLPMTDAQRLRCAKAATENVKKRFFASSGCSLEVLDVFKLDNRVLLQAFQRFTSAIATSETELKIKGLFCCVPTESVERCVVYGMHTGPTGDSEDAGEEPSVLDPQGTGAKIFNRPTYVLSRRFKSAFSPGTHQAFRARSKVLEGPPMRFPRRFSRYSTLEEMRSSLTASDDDDDEPAPTQYLALCRVAMSQTVRVKGQDNQQDVAFPDDPSVDTLHFTDEEYVVRYPEAVVPEFLVQIRMVTPVSRTSRTESTIPVSLTSSVANLASNAFQDWIYSSVLGSQAAKVSAFPLALHSSHQTEEQLSVFAHKEELSPSNSAATLQQEAELASRTEEESASPETVLANCARQKASLREDLSRLERLFWRRAREVWEEEGVSTGIERSGEHGEGQTDNQPHSARDGAPSSHLREELRLARRLEADLAGLELQSQAKTRPRSSRKTENARNAVNGRRRR